MHVSDYYSLGISQPSLEFLDIDTAKDTKVFVDPHSFRFVDADWARECVALLQDFYDELIHAIRTGDRSRGLALLAWAGESDEAHLGLSVGHSQGSGIGPKLAEEIYDALATSAAVTSGIATDVEETVLFVPGILHDRVSDMTINIVRSELIAFTQRICVKYGIDLIPGVDSGPMWDRRSHSWFAAHVDLPIADTGKLLLVPRAVVRKRGTFDPDDYLSYFVLPYMQGIELERVDSPLIEHRSPTGKYRGAAFVTKKSILERESEFERKPAKVINTEITQEEPNLLELYRNSRSEKSEPPSHDDLASLTGSEEPDWDALLQAVLEVPAGSAGADTYHRAVQNLLTALFYPALDQPVREFKMHEGRKRIDIVYANLASQGFFSWLRTQAGVPCGSVVVECKNYNNALGNAEFDQITGRFSPLRGKFGLLLYRGFADRKDAVVQHFRDAALDDRGFVIALDDEDLKVLVRGRKDGDESMFSYLLDRYREII